MPLFVDYGPRYKSGCLRRVRGDAHYHIYRAKRKRNVRDQPFHRKNTADVRRELRRE